MRKPVSCVFDYADGMSCGDWTDKASCGSRPALTERGNGMFRQAEEFSSISAAIHSFAGETQEAVSARPVSGGDINDSYCLVLSDGRCVFLKKNASAGRSFFKAEADGLSAIASTHAVAVPQILAYGEEEGCGFLIMKYIESGRPRADYWETLGRQLALMHKADTAAFTDGGGFGFYEDNFIGQNPQINTPCGSWITFFRDRRLIPQARMAKRYFDRADRKKMQTLLDHLDEYLIEPAFPSLLHGDLWSGNVMPGNDGSAWLIDPAVYVGHAEADLAMTELFGGFPAAFYDAYKEENPLQPGYEDRRDIYNLYHLLNHTNLFGWGYFSAVERILDKYCH